MNLLSQLGPKLANAGTTAKLAIVGVVVASFGTAGAVTFAPASDNGPTAPTVVTSPSTDATPEAPETPKAEPSEAPDPVETPEPAETHDSTPPAPAANCSAEPSDDASESADDN